MLPLLGQHLSGDDVVVYTYAAVAIDRILAIRAPGSPTPLYGPFVLYRRMMFDDFQFHIC